MLMDFFDGYARDYLPYKGGGWCYEDGLIYRGLAYLHKSTGEDLWLDHLQRLIAPQLLDGPGLQGYDPNEYNIDNILSGRALLYLHEVTGHQSFLDAAHLLIDQLATHPRTHSGVYWHKLRYPWQVWLDGLYMGLPFQIGFAQRTGETQLIDDALVQLRTALEIAYVPATRLYAHAIDEARKQPWADPLSGHTQAHWARALGWLAMALVDIAEAVGPTRFAPFRAQTTNLLERVAELKRPNGLWLQVIDRPNLVGNYAESSASAMFVYALLKGEKLGLFSGRVDGLAEALIQNSVASDASGIRHMVDMCHVAGLGFYQGRFRDGSAEYYVSERRVDDDPKGVGPLMMVAAENLTRTKPLVTTLAGK